MKERIDILLVKKGLFPTPEKAQSAILAGDVLVNGRGIDKAGTKIDADSSIEIKNRVPYVSQGGLKLEKALGDFNIDVKGKVCLDVGASTGGFTDCLLQNGAEKVYAVDVGYGQLDYKLRRNPRVIPIEKKNARYLKREELPELTDLITIDVSFISLEKVIPVVKGLLKQNGEILALIKPQFEVKRKEVQKGGVVKDEKLHHRVIDKIGKFATEEGFEVMGTTPTPRLPRVRNVEYFIYMRKSC